MDIKDLPKTVIIPEEFRDMDGELRNDIRQLQNAYTTLKDLKDYDCPTTLEELNTAEIDKLTKERISRVMEDTTLLPSEIEERIGKYKALHRTVARQIHTIENVVARWPEAEFAYDVQVENIVPSANLETIVEAKCTREVPPMAQRHGRLIGNVFAAIARLREFEEEEGVNKIRLEVLGAMDAATFAGRWADGSIKRPVYTTDPWMPSASVREFSEARYL